MLNFCCYPLVSSCIQYQRLCTRLLHFCLPSFPCLALCCFLVIFVFLLLFFVFFVVFFVVCCFFRYLSQGVLAKMREQVKGCTSGHWGIKNHAATVHCKTHLCPVFSLILPSFFLRSRAIFAFAIFFYFSLVVSVYFCCGTLWAGVLGARGCWRLCTFSRHFWACSTFVVPIRSGVLGSATVPRRRHRAFHLFSPLFRCDLLAALNHHANTTSHLFLRDLIDGFVSLLLLCIINHKFDHPSFWTPIMWWRFC